MSFQIKKSFLQRNPLFEVHVAAHAKEVRDWVAREKRVAEDAKNPNVPDAERWVSCPYPVAPNGMVASAVDENGNVSFHVDDDGPSAEDVLKAKKSLLFSELRKKESEAYQAIAPTGKRPFQHILLSEVMERDTERAKKVSRSHQQDVARVFSDYHDKVRKVLENKPGIMQRVAAKAGLITDPVEEAISSVPLPKTPSLDVQKEVESGRSQEDQRVVDENNAVAAADAALSRRVAQLMSDIEDLTEETVDGYQIPDLVK